MDVVLSTAYTNKNNKFNVKFVSKWWEIGCSLQELIDRLNFIIIIISSSSSSIIIITSRYTLPRNPDPLVRRRTRYWNWFCSNYETAVFPVINSKNNSQKNKSVSTPAIRLVTKILWNNWFAPSFLAVWTTVTRYCIGCLAQPSTL